MFDQIIRVFQNVIVLQQNMGFIFNFSNFSILIFAKVSQKMGESNSGVNVWIHDIDIYSIVCPLPHCFLYFIDLLTVCLLFDRTPLGCLYLFQQIQISEYMLFDAIFIIIEFVMFGMITEV